MEYLPELLTVAGVHILAAMSPGPDFAIVTKNSFIHSRKVGLYTALGVGLGISVHVIYSLVGIGFLVSRSILLFNTIKFAGAAYLIYLGVVSLLAKKQDPEALKLEQGSKMSVKSAFSQGLLTNILNPKVTLFFLALFTQVISPETPVFIQAIYGVEMMVMTFVWFALVAFMISHPILTKRFHRAQYYIEKFMGAALVALGIKVATTK